MTTQTPWGVRRIWGFTEMINFLLPHYLSSASMLDSLIAGCHLKSTTGIPEAVIPDEEKERIVRDLQFIVSTCRKMSLATAETRIARIAALLARPVSYSALFDALKILREAIADDVMHERFYHYPRALSELTMSWPADWAPTTSAFPSPEMKFEIRSGVDCYALGHPTAAIFHFMRVVEYGLRALAKERGVRLGQNKPIEWETWQTILTKLEAAKVAINGWRKGPKKDAALGFYVGSLAALHSFKDQYRNMVMHVRKPYEMEDAAKAMRQVKEFMNDISKRVGESTKGSIKTWL